jgi:hypothetical protein
VVTEDYTNWPVGTKTGEGEIGVCPKCGRHGVATIEAQSGFTFYNHGSAKGVDENNVLVLHFDSCGPLPTVAPGDVDNG